MTSDEILTPDGGARWFPGDPSAEHPAIRGARAPAPPAAQVAAQIGRIVRRARSDRDQNQHQLAALCGWTQAKQSRVEHGETIDFATLWAVCAALDMDPIDTLALAASECAPPAQIPLF